MAEENIKIGVDTSEGVREVNKLGQAVSSLHDKFSNLGKTVSGFSLSSFSTAFSNIVSSLKNFNFSNIATSLKGSLSNIVSSISNINLSSVGKTIVGLGANVATFAGQFISAFSTVASGAKSLGSTINSSLGGNLNYKNFSNALEKVSRHATALKIAGDSLNFVWGVVAGTFAATIRVGEHLVTTLSKIQGFQSSISISIGGDRNQAAKEFEFLRSTANTYGIELEGLVENYGRLTASIPDVTDKLDIARTSFMGISMAARALHSSGQDVKLMFYAVTQMASKGTLSMEELRRQLGEKLPGAMEIAARATGYTTKELEDLIRKGVVDSIKFLRLFGPELIRTFAEPAAMAAQSVDGALARLKNVWVDFVKSILDSGAASSIIGALDAIREKLSDPYVMSVFSSVIKDVSDRFSNFVRSLSSEDIRNAFITTANAIELLTKAIRGLAEAMSWVIKNAHIVTPVILGLMGAAKGAQIGAVFTAGNPAGALVGAGVGAAMGVGGGLWLSSNIQEGVNTSNVTTLANKELARLTQNQKATEQALLQYIEGTAKLPKEAVPQLFTPEKLNVNTLTDVGKILGNKNYKTEGQKMEALLSYAKYGVPDLGTRPTSKQDILKPSDKEDKSAKKLAIREQEYLNTLRERTLRLQGEPTELEKVRGDIASGKIGEFSPKVQLDALILAANYDELSKSIKQARHEGEEFEKAFKIIGDIQDKTAEQIIKLNSEIQDFSLKYDFSQAAETERELIPLLRERSQALQTIKDKYRDITDPVYLKLFKSEEEELNKIYEKRIELKKRDVQQTMFEKYDPSGGLNKAVRDYQSSVIKMGDQTAEAMTRIFGAMEDALLQFVTTGKLNIKSLVAFISQEFMRIQIRLFLASMFESPNGKSTTNSIGSFLNMAMGSGLLGKYGPGVIAQWMAPTSLPGTSISYADAVGAGVYPAMASGGPVTGGKAYLVGERGPELIIPNSSGTVIPNEDLNLVKGNTSVHVNLQVKDYKSFVESQSQIQAAIARAVKQGQRNL